jgi:hypothetical protein
MYAVLSELHTNDHAIVISDSMLTYLDLLQRCLMWLQAAAVSRSCELIIQET